MTISFDIQLNVQSGKFIGCIFFDVAKKGSHDFVMDVSS